ncbi:MAG: hypothetical protein Q9202_000580 [Teloschistes flavicans]
MTDHNAAQNKKRVLHSHQTGNKRSKLTHDDEESSFQAPGSSSGDHGVTDFAGQSTGLEQSSMHQLPGALSFARTASYPLRSTSTNPTLLNYPRIGYVVDEEDELNGLNTPYQYPPLPSTTGYEHPQLPSSTQSGYPQLPSSVEYQHAPLPSSTQYEHAPLPSLMEYEQPQLPSTTQYEYPPLLPPTEYEYPALSLSTYPMGSGFPASAPAPDPNDPPEYDPPLFINLPHHHPFTGRAIPNLLPVIDEEVEEEEGGEEEGEGEEEEEEEGEEGGEEGYQGPPPLVYGGHVFQLLTGGPLVPLDLTPEEAPPHDE